MSASADSRPFRLTVLNPGGRDAEQHFPDGAGVPGAGHQPTNFHAYAACTRGSFHRETRRAIAEQTPVLLLLRGDFRHSERALRELQHAARLVAVSLKETGLHQIADQLHAREKLARFIRIVRDADFCIGPTPEAAELYRSLRAGKGGVAFIPTPYPIEHSQWDFSVPLEARAGILVGTREFNVPSRNHLAALVLAREVSNATGESVTVFNFEGRRGARLLAEIGFAPGKLHVSTRHLGYPDYLRQVAKHKLVLQLDTSFVPGQVAGDALLARVPCVGGNGALERLAFPESCGASCTIPDVRNLAIRMLTQPGEYARHVSQLTTNAQRVSFANVAAELQRFFTV